MTAQEGFSLQKVSYSYGDTSAIKDIDLTLVPGKFYGIVGPNGCGKTTLIDLLTGNKKPDKGNIFFMGKEISSCSRKHLALHLALVPQEYSINFAFSVKEVVMMGRHPYLSRFGNPSRNDLEQVDAAMARIGIRHLKDRYVNELSGGEKQRVAVARALAQQTPVLLLDEATSNLDIRYTLQILHALQTQVHVHAKTVIAVMHNLNIAASFCDEILLMRDGQVIKKGVTREILCPENIQLVFDVESAVRFDEFSGSLQISFKTGDQSCV